MIVERVEVATKRSEYDRCVHCELEALHLEEDGEAITWALIHDLRYLKVTDRLPFAGYAAELWAAEGLRIAEPCAIVDWARVFEYTGIGQCRGRRMSASRVATA